MAGHVHSAATTISLLLAALLAFSGPRRWTGQAWVTMHQTGGPHVWAAFYLLSALALVYGRRRGLRGSQWALYAAALLHALWAAGFIVAVERFPEAGNTGIVAYAGFAWLWMAAADRYWDRRVEQQRVAAVLAEVEPPWPEHPPDGGGP